MGFKDFSFFYISAFSVFCDGIFWAFLLILTESDFSFGKKKKKKKMLALLLFSGGFPLWAICGFVIFKGLPL